MDAIMERIPEIYSEKVDHIFSGDMVYRLTKKLNIDSDIGLATSLIFLTVSILFGWLG